MTERKKVTVKKYLVFSVLVASGVLGGCVTTSLSKSEYQAEISGLEAELAAVKGEIRTHEIVNGAIARLIEIYGWADGRRPHRPAGVSQ